LIKRARKQGTGKERRHALYIFFRYKFFEFFGKSLFLCVYQNLTTFFLHIAPMNSLCHLSFSRSLRKKVSWECYLPGLNTMAICESRKNATIFCNLAKHNCVLYILSELFAFGRQQSCPPKALKALFDPPPQTLLNFIYNVYYDTFSHE
jgi:hypothetical protein